MYIIAEMSGNHNQDIELAKEIVRAAARSGADAIKTQAYDADELTINCNNSHFMVDHPVWGGQSLYELYQKAHTPWEFHEPLMKEAEACGIEYISTAYDLRGARFLLDLGLKKIKIASFEMTYLQLVDELADSNAQILLSTGMATDSEIETVVKRIPQGSVVFHCTSAYPAPPSSMNLSRMKYIKSLGMTPGLSDHSIGSVAPIVALSLGAEYLEKHFMLNDQPESVDSHFSMNEHDFTKMVSEIRNAEDMLSGDTRDKDQKPYTMFRRSVFFVKDILAGEEITDKHIAIIRPGYGAHPFEYNNIIGTVAHKNHFRGEPVELEQI